MAFVFNSNPESIHFAAKAKFIRRLVAATVVLNLLLFGAVCWILQEGKNQYDLRARASSQSISRVISGSLANKLDKIDLILQFARDEAQSQLAAGGIDRRRMNDRLAVLQARMPEMFALRLVDEEGVVRYGRDVNPDSSVNIANDDHFIHLRNHPEAGAVVSRPKFGIISQKWVIKIARRHNHPGGTFAGVVSSVVEIDHLISIFNRLDVGQHGHITLRDAGLGLVARYPQLDDITYPGPPVISQELKNLVRQGDESATFPAASSFDGMRRITTCSRVDGWPLILCVGLSEKDYLAVWHKAAMNAIVTAAIISLISIFVTWLLFHYWRVRTEHINSLKHNQEMFHFLAEMSSDWIWEQDRDFRFVNLVGDISRKVGFGEEYFKGRTRWECATDADDPKWAEHRAVLEAHAPFQDFEYTCLDPFGRRRTLTVSGRPLFDLKGQFHGYRGITRDITERKLYEERIRYMAQHDSLTLLPNRVLFYDRLDQAVRAARRKVEKFALYYIDLDRFKPVNDRFGHDAGDRVLIKAARRMQDALRASDTLARLGGDEFAVIAFEVVSANDIVTVAQKLIDTLAAPYLLANAPEPINIGVSIGIAVFPHDSENANDLVKAADDAMYRAKQNGNAYRFSSWSDPSHHTA